MKKKDTKLTQEQIDAARQKKLMSSDFKSRVKKSIQALKTFNINCRKNALTKSDIRGIAKYFAERIDLSSRAKEPVVTDAANEDVVPKKSLKY